MNLVRMHLEPTVPGHLQGAADGHGGAILFSRDLQIAALRCQLQLAESRVRRDQFVIQAFGQRIQTDANVVALARQHLRVACGEILVGRNHRCGRIDKQYGEKKDGPKGHSY